MSALNVKITMDCCGYVSYYLSHLLHLGPNFMTDRTLIALGFKMLLRMGLLLRLGPNVITDGTLITLVSLCPVITLVPSTTVSV